MSARAKLFTRRDPYDLPGTDALFVQAMRENCAFHYARCPEYRAILDHLGFAPEELNTVDDLVRLPVLPTALFKGRTLFSMSRWRVPVVATSSGTKGQFSQVGYETSGLLCALGMSLCVGRLHHLFSPVPVHYVMLGYKPHRGNRTAVTKTAMGTTFMAPALSRTFALKYRPNGYAPDLEGIIRALERHSQSPFPLRMVGFPSYTYFVLKEMVDRGITLRTAPGSRIMLGGGWKQFYTQQVDKRVLYALAERVLSIPEDHITEFFGAVEHPILYCDCPRHHFHVPVYSRVIIRDVNTLEPVPNGTVGLVSLLTPLIKSTPILSVMTDDLGVLHDGTECGCGIPSPYLEIIGRVGLKEIKTCAAGAAELLAGVKL